MDFSDIFMTVLNSHYYATKKIISSVCDELQILLTAMVPSSCNSRDLVVGQLFVYALSQYKQICCTKAAVSSVVHFLSLLLLVEFDPLLKTKIFLPKFLKVARFSAAIDYYDCDVGGLTYHSPNWDIELVCWCGLLTPTLVILYSVVSFPLLFLFYTVSGGYLCLLLTLWLLHLILWHVLAIHVKYYYEEAVLL